MVTAAEPVTVAVAANLNCSSTYRAAAGIAEPPAVVKPLRLDQVPVSSAVPIVAVPIGLPVVSE